MKDLGRALGRIPGRALGGILGGIPGRALGGIFGGIPGRALGGIGITYRAAPIVWRRAAAIAVLVVVQGIVAIAVTVT